MSGGGLFGAWRRRRQALACREVVELLTDYLEGALSPRDHGRIEAHLAACPHCSEYLHQMRVAIDAVGRVEVDELDESAREDLLVLYRQWRAG